MRSPVNYIILWQPPGTTPFPAGFQDANDPRWTLGGVFLVDLARDGFHVNGQHVRTEAAFMALMPDRRTAAQISRVMHQGLGGIIGIEAPENLRTLLFRAYQERRLMSSNTANTPQRASLAPLGGGAYRVTFEFGKHVKEVTNADRSAGVPLITDAHHAVSFTIQTGPEFTIRDVDVDATVFML